MNQLRKAFEAFGRAAEGPLFNKGVDATTYRIDDFRGRRLSNLDSLVAELEDKNEFRNLTGETRRHFKEREETPIDLLKHTAVEAYSNPFDFERYLDQLDDLTDDDLWMEAIHNFFCRSGYYSSLLSGKSVDTEKLFRAYCDEFKKGKVEVKYLLALKNVEFSQTVLEFDKFYIKKFNAKELEALLQNTINASFFPYAFFDLNEIKKYWYIVIADTMEFRKIWDKERFFRGSYSHYPKSVQSVFLKLILYDWEKTSAAEFQMSALDGLGLGEFSGPTYKFIIPFILETNSCLYCFPQKSHRFPEWVSHTECNFFRFNREETESFMNFVRNSITLCNSLSKQKSSKETHAQLLSQEICELTDYDFLNFAFKYLVKAFLSEGIEELVWHVVTIECLLEEKGENITQTLARRVSTILEEDAEERKKIQKQFKELYNFRCELIHGAKPRKGISGYQFLLARNMARRTTLWFLENFGKLKYEFAGRVRATDRLIRKQILQLIDGMA